LKIIHDRLGGGIIDVLQKIDDLMKERGWSRYELAKQCGMSLSTISNMFKRNTIPTITTIEIISKAFGLTLSQFFDYGSDSYVVHLTLDQKKMFERWSTLTADQKELFFKFIENMK